MSKIKLGLDIGTNSIGWAVLEKEDGKYHFLENYNADEELIPSRGSYIFPKGTEANEKSKAAIRRGFRGARRRIDRIRLRKVATLKVLSKYDLCPSFLEGELNRWKNKKIYPCNNEKFIEWQRTGKRGGNSISEKLKQPYYLRHLAATQEGLMDTKIGRHQLGRAFYHLAQRRGYLSNGEDEQTEDKIDLFKLAVNSLLEEHSSGASFIEPFTVIWETYKSTNKGDKVKGLGNKILRVLKKETSFQEISKFIKSEFSKKENLGKVEQGIKELSQKIEDSGMPTMGSYFNSVYAKSNEEGIIGRIRGRYTHREKHYLHEFNCICDKQNISDDLRKALYNSIFYQRPLKSQKGLVAKCPFETKRKRIAKSHPLFEEFRMWESINRIKIKTVDDSRLRRLNINEKQRIQKYFQMVKDCEFGNVAEELSTGREYRYIRDKNKLSAEVEFNFPMDKTFSGSPTTARLKKLLGLDYYNRLPFLNSGYKNEKGKKQVSIEDLWHCLFADSFVEKNIKQVRKEFALKHLQLDINAAETFSKIKLKKGYGNLSKSAIKKILPFLKDGENYSHAVFLANISGVLGREPNDDEKQKIEGAIKHAIEEHGFNKSVNGIVNNYIEKFKANKDSFGKNKHSLTSHQKGITEEIENWFTKNELEQMSKKVIDKLRDDCWHKFEKAAINKSPKEMEFLSLKTIPQYISDSLQILFPKDKIDINKLYHPSAMEAYPKAEKELGNPEISAIKNPVFNKAMYQIRRLVNKLIEEDMVDKDTVVNIEMAREINSASYRKALSQWQKDQAFIRNWAREKIIESYKKDDRENIIPTDSQIMKFILYAEQNKRCIYTNEGISPRLFLTEQKFDIEHTIPRSQINDNSLKNKTLANANFNRNYKKDELPAILNVNYEGSLINSESILRNRDSLLMSYRFVGKKPKINIEWNVSLNTLSLEHEKLKKAAQAASSDPLAHDELMERVHYTKMKLDYLREKYSRFEIKEVTTRFSNANLVDTRLITKYARAYLKSYFKRVNVVNGKITDTLRKVWGLQGEYEPKDRSNHIHHCIDAVTVACVEKGTVNRISEAYHKFEYDYFRGNSSTKIRLDEPMKDFVREMKNLQEKVFIHHNSKDRIRPLLEAENPKKFNLRGALNSQNPYGHRRDDENFFFVQRKSITKIKEKDIGDIFDERIRERIQKLCEATGKKIDKLVSENNGFLLLPDYEAKNSKGKLIKSAPMVIKKLRLKSSKTKLNPYKKIRELDRSKSKGKEYKHDFYFNKESNSNYEARIYGDLIPDKPLARTKFNKRDYYLVNHYNIVNNIFKEEPALPFLFSIHRGDAFLAFDKHPDEIQWDSIEDIERRLFRVAKFDENKNINLLRHNYALGDVDRANPANEEVLKSQQGVKLKRTPGTLRVVPCKIDVLGRIDVEYSKQFIEQHL